MPKDCRSRQDTHYIAYRKRPVKIEPEAKMGVFCNFFMSVFFACHAVVSA